MIEETSPLGQYLQSWGVKPKGQPSAKEYSCPGCGRFSFFSCCDPARNQAAIEWRGATVGFSPMVHNSVSAGIAVLRCPECSLEFAVTLSAACLSAYAADCPSWGKNPES